jgi:hypothetical protein
VIKISGLYSSPSRKLSGEQGSS